MANEIRQPYQAPTVFEFGGLEEITQGALSVNLDDFPVGAKVVCPSGAVCPPPNGGVLPQNPF
ncbi:MAG TPA: lasso RiPP family leader peptide-containing protein [Actinomycetota bacterium]|nr:lasso RiPP family leader peptide-containing protein [Actinomycetota bacterium]